MSVVNAVRGMNDILPETSDVWQYVESAIRETLHLYHFREIRLPLVEKTELFARSIGDATDIVAKEMYTFDDRNGDSLSLRPEGTASCVRAGLQHGLFHNQNQRLWYMGPMFRHERPQRGRYRQFHQVGAEVFGWPGPDVDAELIALGERFWHRLNLASPPKLYINSLGDGDTRRRYEVTLVEYLQRYRDELDADSQRRLDTNPLRILDAKNLHTCKILESAPNILEALDSDSKQHFEQLCAYLNQLGIAFTVDAKLVRGLDYYTRTVFEWVSGDLGAQGAVCAGGRYDGLVQQLGGKKAVPAMGFAMGLERLIELVVADQVAAGSGSAPEVYFITLGAEARRLGWSYAERLRERGISVQSHCGDGSMKNQMRHADKSGARLAAMVGDDEVQTGSVTVRFLRESNRQVTIPVGEFETQIDEWITNDK